MFVPMTVVEHDAAEMGCRAGAGRAERHLRLVLLGVGDEFLEVVDRQVLARDQRDRHLGDQGDRREVGRRVVERLLVEGLVLRVGADACRARSCSRRAALARRVPSRSCRRRRRRFRPRPAGRAVRSCAAATTRPIRSVGPPAANGMTMVTGRLG